MSSSNRANNSSASEPVGDALPESAKHSAKMANWMQAVLIAFAILNIAALIGSYAMNRVIVSQYTPMLDAVLHVKQRVIRSHLWLREHLVNSDSLGLEEIIWHLDGAHDIVEAVIKGRQVHLLTLSSRPDGSLKSDWLLLLENIERLQDSAQVALAEADQPKDQIWSAASKYDKAVREVVSFADLLEARLELKINKNMESLQRLQLFGIGFFVVLIASGTWILRKGFRKLVLEMQHRHAAERQLKLSRAQAIAARDELAAAIAAKNQFLGKVSHEVRNLTNAIFGLATMIESTDLDRAQSSYVRMLESETHTLLRVMEDLLELSKLKSDGPSIARSPFLLRRLLADMVDLYVLEADAKGIQLDIDLPLDFPEPLVGDPARVRQVVINLLKNAIKYTDKGAVVAGVRCRRIVDSHGEIEIWVRDSGMGIPIDSRDNIFDPFARVEETATQSPGGTGLGLAICHELVTLMDGEVWFEDVPGGGTKFLVSLPLKLADGASTRPPAPRLNGMRLLVSDLDDCVRGRTCGLLQECGASIDITDTGAEALVSLAQQPAHDVVVISDRLPDLDPEQFTSRLRASPPPLAETRVVVIRRSSVYVHANGELDDDLTMQLAAPFRALDLGASLRPEAATLPAEPSKETEAVGHTASLDVLLVDDHPVMQIAGRHMLESMGCQVDSAHDGTSALLRWSAKEYDVIFIDGEMPDIDGLEVTRRIRQQDKDLPRSRRPYIVGIAANTVTCSRERCLEAGMDDYIGKPVVKESIVRVLRDFNATDDATTGLDDRPAEPTGHPVGEALE